MSPLNHSGSIKVILNKKQGRVCRETFILSFGFVIKWVFFGSFWFKHKLFKQTEIHYFDL